LDTAVWLIWAKNTWTYFRSRACNVELAAIGLAIVARLDPLPVTGNLHVNGIGGAIAAENKGNPRYPSRPISPTSIGRLPPLMPLLPPAVDAMPVSRK
jgi:hypothetical protein